MESVRGRGRALRIMQYTQTWQTGIVWRTLLTAHISVRIMGHQEKESRAWCLIYVQDLHCKQSLILKQRLDLFTAVQTAEGFPLRFFTRSDRSGKTEDVTVQLVFASSWLWCFSNSSGLLFNKLQSGTLKTFLFPRCWSWQSYFLIN